MWNIKVEICHLCMHRCFRTENKRKKKNKNNSNENNKKNTTPRYQCQEIIPEQILDPFRIKYPWSECFSIVLSLFICSYLHSFAKQVFTHTWESEAF